MKKLIISIFLLTGLAGMGQKYYGISGSSHTSPITPGEEAYIIIGEDAITSTGSMQFAVLYNHDSLVFNRIELYHDTAYENLIYRAVIDTIFITYLVKVETMVDRGSCTDVGGIHPNAMFRIYFDLYANDNDTVRFYEPFFEHTKYNICNDSIILTTYNQSNSSFNYSPIRIVSP